MTVTDASMATSLNRSRIHPLRAIGFVLAIGLLAALVPLSDRPLLLGNVFAMILCVVGPIWFQWRKGTLDVYEPIHVIGLLYIVYFGFGAIWAVNDPVKVAYDTHLVPYIPFASFLSLLGMIGMQFGYWGFWRKRVPRRDSEWMPVGSMFVVIPAALGFLGHAAEAAGERGQALPLIGGLTSAVSQLAPLYSFAWALGCLLVIGGLASRSMRWFVVACMLPATAIVMVILLNNKSLLLVLAGTPLIALWYTKRRVPWIPLTSLLLILVFVIFPFNNLYRQLDPEIPMSMRVELTLSQIGKWDTTQYLDRSVGTFKERLALINSVAVVRRDVGKWVPYALGETIFMPTLVYFVPRVLWPGKPLYTFGRDFGVKFRVVNILDKETRIAVTVPGELYWNFGIPGVILGMAFWGLVMRLLYRRYGESPDLDPVNRAVQILVLVQFVHYGGGLALEIDNTIRILAMLEIYRILSIRFGLLHRGMSMPMPPIRVPGRQQFLGAG